MLEERDVGRVLTGDTLADGAVAGVVVERLGVRVGVHMVAPSGILMGHVFLPCFVVGPFLKASGPVQNHHGSDALARVSATSLTKISVQSRRDRKSTRLNSSH